jgi:hypothetical protein
MGFLTSGQVFGGYAPACATITLIYLVGMAVVWRAPGTPGPPQPQ